MTQNTKEILIGIFWVFLTLSVVWWTPIVFVLFPNKDEPSLLPIIIIGALLPPIIAMYWRLKRSQKSFVAAERLCDQKIEDFRTRNFSSEDEKSTNKQQLKQELIKIKNSIVGPTVMRLSYRQNIQDKIDIL